MRAVVAKEANPNLLRCLAVQQPWAWGICTGLKTVENRTQPTPYRGQVAILASTKQTNVNDVIRDAAGKKLKRQFFAFGAIIGVATLVDVKELDASLEDNPSATGPLCWMFESPLLLPEPIPAKGKLNLYSLTEVESNEVRRQLTGLKPQPPTAESQAWAGAYRDWDFKPYQLAVSRASSYRDLGRFDDAIRQYDLAVRLQPQNPDLFFLRGVAFDLAGQPEAAMRDIDHAIQLEPNVAQFFTYRAEMHQEAGRFDEVVQDYDRAAQLEPDEPSFRIRGIVALLDKPDPDAAIRVCTQQIRSEPNEAVWFMLRREAHLLKEDAETAEGDYVAALSLNRELVEQWNAPDEEVEADAEDESEDEEEE